MAILTDDMKRLADDRSSIHATVCPDGSPNRARFARLRERHARG